MSYTRRASWPLLLVLPGCLLVFPEDQPAPEEPPQPPPPVELVCTEPLADCDGADANGCEADLSSNPSSCGACGQACEPGAACNASTCSTTPEVIASGQVRPTRIVVRDGDLYWIHAAATGSIQRLRRDLPEPDLFVSGQPGPESLSVDEEHVYWANTDGGSIVRMKRAGLPRVPETVATGLNAPRSIARHGEHLYWTSAGDRAAYRCSIQECSPTRIATLSEPAVSVAASELAVFVAGVTSVLQVDPSLSSAFTLVDHRSAIVGLASSDSQVLWIERGGPSLRSSGVVAGWDTGLREIATTQDGPVGIAIDGEFVYWTNLLGGTVMRAPRAGGSAETIATNQGQPWGIAVDERGVYWTAYGSGRVMRVLFEQAAE